MARFTSINKIRYFSIVAQINGILVDRLLEEITTDTNKLQFVAAEVSVD